ncbi:hypothetical protein LINPERPRIM_LOCUS23474 [Linum perenne]
MMLLIPTMAVSHNKQQAGCGNKEPPVYADPCKFDYDKCVITVITKLQYETPKNENHRFYMSFPVGFPSGGVEGHASCGPGASLDDCKSCLSIAMLWLSHCGAASRTGHYSYGYCAMSYKQIH